VKLTRKEYSELCNNDAIKCVIHNGSFTVGCIYRVVESIDEPPCILNDNFLPVQLEVRVSSISYPFVYSLFERVVKK
jgi:hypothetical protein